MKRCLLVLLLAVLGASARAAAIYPMEGGTLRRSGQAQGITHVALPIDVLWSANLCGSEPRSNPIILSDRIVQTLLTGIVCVSRFDGKVIWRAGAYGGLWNPAAYDPDRDLLYQSTTLGVVSALRPADGSEAWHYYEGSAKGCQNQGSCTYDQGRIYFGTANGKVVCLDADTQAVIWSFNLGSATGIGTPALDGGLLYVGTLTGNLYCLNASTGAVVWQKSSALTCYSSAISLDDTRLYAMTNLGKVECRSRVDGSLLWTFQTGSWTLSNLSVGPRGLYCTSDDRCMYRLDESTGAIIWRTCFSGNFARSSPFCAGDMVFASGCTASFYGADAATGAANWDLYHTAWNSFTDFAEADGLLYVTDLYGILYCIHPQNSPYPPTVTASPTLTVTSTATRTVTRTETQTSTATPSATATPTPSSTATSSMTVTPSNTPSATPTLTATATRTSTSTATPSSSSTASPTFSSTATPTSTITLTPTQSATPSITPSSSATPSVSMTHTHTAVPTATPQERDGEGLKDPGDDDIYAGPNPVHGGPCKVVYRMRGPGTCRVRIFQASGDPVGLVEQRHETAGVHSCQVSTQRYAPGVYYYRADRQYDDGQSDKLPLKKLLVLKAR